MTSIEYCQLNTFQKFIYKLKQFFVNLPRNFVGLFVTIGKYIAKGAIGIKNGFVHIGTCLIRGDIFTKLSFVIMGAGNLFRGQIVKGLIYLATEAVFIWFMISTGGYYLSLFGTLGVAVKKKVFDEAKQIFVYEQGDNSILILLFGSLVIVFCLAFFIIYLSNVKSAYKAQCMKKSGKKLPSFLQECKTLFDERYHITMLTLPTIGTIVFTILPIIFMILMAFTNFDKNHQPPGNLFTWVGLTNFANILWNNPIISNTFGNLLGWTLIWAFFATFSSYIFGMLLAILINKKGIHLKAMWRTIFVITIAVPQFVSLLLMSKMLHELGPINVILKDMGLIQTAIPFLTDATLARITVIIVNMWVGIPYTMLITTGILMNIPKDLYESATIDGANAIQTFFKITLPYMLFVTTPYLITSFIGNINNFNVIFLLSGGGPLTNDYYQAGKTDLLITWLYKLTVNEHNYSLASTIGIMIFVVCAFFSLIVYNKSGATTKEEAFQ